MSVKLISFDFEIFGRVQGVFFRKCTHDKAVELGVKGWCKNTPQGTVEGQAQGPIPQIHEMKYWLQKTGSPQSKIDKAVFKNELEINGYKFDKFDVIRRPR